MSSSRRRAMIDPNHGKLSIVRQCAILKISRSAHYYKSKGEKPLNIELMGEIDRIFLQWPSLGVRQMRRYLVKQGYPVGNKRVRRLMRLMGLMPIYQKPHTSIPGVENKRYPYLLSNLEITRSNQVWCSDITYIPMKRGFLYLTAIMDWHSRKILSWRLSNTLETDFCVAALEEAIEKYEVCEIFNTDQGSQYTSFAFTKVLEENGIQISMDGRGRCMDNIFIERLWRSLKYEEVYTHAYENGTEAKSGIGSWIDFYNRQRPHSSLFGKTPDEYYAERKNVA